MFVRSVQRTAGLCAAAFLVSLGGCEEKKTFKHEAEWPSPLKATPKPIHTDTPEGTAEAIETRLDDIVTATQEIYSEADAHKAADKMKAAYSDLDAYVTKLKTQEAAADGPNRKAVAMQFMQTQQELAKSVADLFERDQKIAAVIGDQLGQMPFLQDPPDPPPADAAPSTDDFPPLDSDASKPSPKPKTKASPKPR